MCYDTEIYYQINLLLKWSLSSVYTMKIHYPQLQVYHAHSHCCRCNNPGDKDHALSVMEEQLKHQENHVSDVLCLCGRIYKDKFVESDYIDNECRDKAIHW